MGHDVDSIRRCAVIGRPLDDCPVEVVRQIRQAGREVIGRGIADIQATAGDRSQIPVESLSRRATVVGRHIQRHGNPPVPETHKEIRAQRVANILERLDDVVVALRNWLEGKLVGCNASIEQVVFDLSLSGSLGKSTA